MTLPKATKKSVFFLLAVMLTGAAQAAAPVKSDAWTPLDRPVPDAPAALEYFSFYCPACYRYDEEMQVTATVKKALPENVRLTQYHARFMGPLGDALTQAWSVAMLLDIEDKMKPLLFDVVQKKRTITTEADIRRVFTEAGVSADSYDAAWNSFAVKSMTIKQNTLAEKLELTGIPAMFINGQYRINPAGLDTRSAGAFAASYAATVRHLLTGRQ